MTPLINHPEVGILGVHRIGPRPVVRDGEVVVRSIGNVSVTFDHRVVDGARAAAFSLAVIAPARGRAGLTRPPLRGYTGPRWAAGTRSGSSPGSARRSGSPRRASLRRAPVARVVGAVVGGGDRLRRSGSWDEAVGGVVGGVCGALGAAPLVAGALRRGGTRGGTAALLGLAALVAAALAFVPIVGYLEAVVVPALGAAAPSPRARHARGPAHARP